MKNILANFSGQVLSKYDMKFLQGGVGNCAVRSYNPSTGGGTTGGYNFSEEEAQTMADEFNGYNDEYIYTVVCNNEETLKKFP